MSGEPAPKTGLLRPAPLLLAACCLAAGAAGGWVARGLRTQDVAETAVVEIREQGPHYTSALLDCETGRQALGNRPLRPFQDKVQMIAASAVAAGRAGQVSVYFRDLNNGPWFSLHPEARFVPASLTKLPILIAFLKRSEQDPGLLAREIVYTPPSADLNDLQRFRPKRRLVPGQPYRVADLLERLIVDSDNNALPLLQSQLRDREVLESLSAMGIGFRQHLGEGGYISVEDYAAFFRILFNASYLRQETSEAALALLTRISFTQGLRAGVPAEVEVAHKFGEFRLPAGEPLPYQLHDCGIVYAPRSPYLLCVMTRGERIEPLPGVIAEVSRAVYGSISSQRPQR